MQIVCTACILYEVPILGHCTVPVLQFGQVVVAEVADDPGGAVGAPPGVAGQGEGVQEAEIVHLSFWLDMWHKGDR